MRAGIYVAYTTTGTAVADGGTLPLSTIVRRYGCAVNLSGNTIRLTENGYYDVEATVTLQATAATSAYTVTLYQDGVPVNGATASGVAAAEGDLITLPIAALVRVQCNPSLLYLVVSGTAAETANTAFVVEKV